MNLMNQANEPWTKLMLMNLKNQANELNEPS